MEGQENRSGITKVVFLILLFESILLLMVHIPLQIIPEIRVLFQDMLPTGLIHAPYILFAAIILWLRPTKKETKYSLIVAVVINLTGLADSFYYEFGFVFTEFRLLYSLVFILPLIAIIFQVLTFEVKEQDIDVMHHEVFIDEIMAHDSLEEGFNYALAYIGNPNYEFDRTYRQSFLDYLALRDDRLGELARIKIEQESQSY